MRERFLASKHIAFWICRQINMHRQLRSQRPGNDTIRNWVVLDRQRLSVRSYLRLRDCLRNIGGRLRWSFGSSEKFPGCKRQIKFRNLTSQHHSLVRTELHDYPY